MVVLDCLVEIESPFSTATATAHVAQVLKSYNVRTCTADDHAKGWLKSELARHGITLLARPPGTDSSSLHLEALALFTAGRVRLIKNTRLIEQYLGLEQKPRGDRDWVGHGPGQHDDLAVATSGVLWVASHSAGSALWRVDHFLVDGVPVEMPRTPLALFAVLVGSDQGELGTAYFHVVRTSMGCQLLYLIDGSVEPISPDALRNVHKRVNELVAQAPTYQIFGQTLVGTAPDIYCPLTISEQLDDVLKRQTNARVIDHLLASDDLALSAAIYINSGSVKITDTVLSRGIGLGFLDGLPGKDDDVLKTCVLAGIVAGFHPGRLTAPPRRRGPNANLRNK